MKFEKQNIIDKVNTLRDERNMMTYCDASSLSHEAIKLTKKIITMIQYTIFDIDAVFEMNTLPVEQLQHMGNQAKQAIMAQVSIAIEDSEKANTFTKRLFSFYEMEMDMRRANKEANIKTPLDYSIDEFYVLKSCDVFLSRQIVTILANQHELYNELVGMYDQLGEVLDDMMDVEEDIDAINSNRFLISLVAFGTEKTLKEYGDFIDQSLPLLVANH